MARSVRVTPEYIRRVKLALQRIGYRSQGDLAGAVGLSRSTVAKFFSGQPIDYRNFQEICDVLQLDWQDIAYLGDDTANTSFLAVQLNSEEKSFQPRQDWGDAPDVSVFYGRTEELATLQQWIVGDRCRLVGLLGMGGIGKTALAVKLAQQIQDEFEWVIWRSLRNAPPVEDLLADLLQVLSNQQKTDLPDTLDGKISLLLQYLRRHRCLLVLDSAESILQSGSLAGHYREGCEGYEELIRLVGEVSHQSCLLLSSREKLREIALLEGDTRAVRSLKLLGLGELDSRKIVQKQGLSDPENWITLIQRYQGNPLALRIVSGTIRDIFNGKVSDFLGMNILLVGSMLYDLLREQLHRLSDLETKIMCCIANQDQPVSLQKLREYLQPKVALSKIIQALESLTWRSLIEQITEARELRFTVHPVVREYVLIEYLNGGAKRKDEADSER